MRLASKMVSLARRICHAVLSARSKQTAAPQKSGDLDAFAETLRERARQRSALAVCSLAEYRNLVGHLPRPSAEQIDRFVAFVATDHSWYKRLPLLPPGAPFHFFLDPLAGYTRLIQPQERVLARARTEHESRGAGGGGWRWTTDEYRSRFGHLACDRAGGIRHLELVAGSLGEYGECDVFCAGDRAYRIPEEIRLLGRAMITAVIHPRTARARVWQQGLLHEEGRSWPEETGGEEVLRRIRDLCADELYPQVSISDELLRLFAPERRRLMNEMKGAIRRMLDAVF